MSDPVDRVCVCGAPVKSRSRSGLCRSCAVRASMTPEVLARRSATLRRRLATEPELRARYAAMIASTRTGPVDARRMARLRAAKLPSWLPLEYRPLWRDLRAKRRTLDEAEAAVREQMRIDARRFARTGTLPQTGCGR